MQATLLRNIFDQKFEMIYLIFYSYALLCAGVSHKIPIKCSDV